MFCIAYKEILYNFIILGVPVLALDQSKINAAAHRSIVQQSGRPLAQAESVLDTSSMSLEAKERLDVLENLYNGSLPDNMPSFELLAKMPVKDCIDIVNVKREVSREASEGVSDVDAFKQATIPVVYNLPQIDDRLTQLHSASFLRAPLSEPAVYTHLIPKKLPQVSSDFSF